MPHAYQPPSRELRRWVAEQVHSRARVTAVARLLGGITADMDRLTVESPLGVTDVVLRRWPADEQAQDLVTREAAALTAIHGRGVPAPELVAIDADGARTGVRCTLTSALPGQPDLAPTDLSAWLRQLATTQAAIHDAPATLQPHPGPDRYGRRHRTLDWLVDPGLREAARAATEGPLDAERVLVHGDYQHFNVLWSAGRLTGVVDWPSAATGSRGTDVGHCRLNLAVLFGAEVADDYLTGYERVADVQVDRRADLRALLCFDLDWQHFIPRQVAGRADLEVNAMPARVAAATRTAVDRLG